MKAKETRPSDGIISECRITCQNKREHGFGLKTVGWPGERKILYYMIKISYLIDFIIIIIVLMVNYLTSVICWSV